MLRIISGKHRNRILRSPKGSTTRPTTGRTREMLFNIWQQEIEGARFLDIFAGSGAIGLEALSRGASEAVFIEEDRSAARYIRENLELLNENARVITDDALRWLRKGPADGRQFDLIYADPPYERVTAEGYLSDTVAQLIDECGWLKPTGRLFIEESSQLQPAPIVFKTLVLERIRENGSTQIRQYKVGDAPS